MVELRTIKIYKDTHVLNEEEVLLPYKGKILNEPGIIFCPYVKPTWYRRLWNKIKSLFRKKSKATDKAVEL